MSDATKSLLSDLLTAYNAHDLTRAALFYAPNYEGVEVGNPEPQRGPQGFRDNFSRYLNAFPDLQFTEEEAVISDGRIAIVWTARGTHRGRWMNIPATGRSVSVRGVSVLTLVRNKITRGFVIWDVAALLRGIGLLPEL